MAKFHQARVVLLVSVFLTAVLFLVPQLSLLAYPFMLLSTVAHETGHGFTAMMVGEEFREYRIGPDGSGVAKVTESANPFGRAAVAAGGLLGPAVAAALGFALGRTARGARRGLIALSVILALSLVFVVRGFFGFFFVAFVLAFCALVASKASDEIAQLVLVFLAVQMALSVFSRGDYLFTPTARTSVGGVMPSDVGQIAEALVLPYWFWGALCGLVSVAVLLYGLKAYWRD